MREITVETASGVRFPVPGVRPGHEWRVENELMRLLGEEVRVVASDDAKKKAR